VAESPIVEARELYKAYRAGSQSVEALRGVDLTIRKGEIVAMMGPSGCGKTTLLHCLAGLDSFDSGDVLVDGASLRHMSDDEKTDLRARQMGFVFQAYNLLPILSARENVELPLLLTAVRPAEARRRALAALEAVGLCQRADNRPDQLSGGQQQRVAIARALVHSPAVVWADEPTGNLDSEAAEEIMDLFSTLHRERGQSFVIVTHSAAVASRAERVVRMRDGRIVGEQPRSPRPLPASTNGVSDLHSHIVGER
jgi:putative ABC transport system ATP-binding protein